MMEAASEDDMKGLDFSRPRLFSQQSTESSKLNFPLMTCDSGLYTCSSNTSDCSLPLESDLESDFKIKGHKDEERLSRALQEARKLRSELERLTKSEHWYKQELRQQKTTRLEDLERIYTQERKFMQENQRLQKECVRLYEKCSDLEKDMEKQQMDDKDHQQHHHFNDELDDEDKGDFEREQHLALIKDQQQLIVVLRKQKRSLLKDLSLLTEEKDEKVMDLQRLLADLEFDNKHITQKCKQYAKDHLNLQENLKQKDVKLSLNLNEKLNLQKTLNDLKEQLQIQQQLVQLKDNEITRTQKHYTDKIQKEQDLDEVHRLSVKYQQEMNAKTIEIIQLKERLNEMQTELEDVQRLKQQNDEQQRQIEQLNFSLETFHQELQQLKFSEAEKNQQLSELHLSIQQLLSDKDILNKSLINQQKDLFNVRSELKYTIEQHLKTQELYKQTQFQVELLEMEQGTMKFQTSKDHQEIEELRQKLKEYLQKTTDLSKKIQILEVELERSNKENKQLQNESKILKQELNKLQDHKQQTEESDDNRRPDSLIENTSNKDLTQSECKDPEKDEDFLELTKQTDRLQENLERLNNSHLHNGKSTILQILQDFMNKIENNPKEEEESGKVTEEDESFENDEDILQLTKQRHKFLENLDNLKEVLKEKDILFEQLNSKQQSNECMKKLVIENEILKKKLLETETEAFTLQLKQNINEKTQKCLKLEENFQKQFEKVKDLQEKLLKNDSNLYKMERLLQNNSSMDDLQKENQLLKEELLKEQFTKTDLNKKLQEEKELVQDLRQSLEDIKLKQRPTINKAIQCDFNEDSDKPSSSIEEIEDLKIVIQELQQQQSDFLEKETQQKAERLQLLKKLMDLQNTKILNVQQHQQDWEDMLSSLNYAQNMEEQMRQELQLKRQELEELNEVFGQQNEELRKLEEFTMIIDKKRQQEKETLKLTFQQEIQVMKQNLNDCHKEIEQYKLANLEIEKIDDRIPEENDYKKEIYDLKSTLSETLKEKQHLLKQLNDLQEEPSALELNEHKRNAIYMPELAIAKAIDIPKEYSLANSSILTTTATISEDHLRILTKVLEAEYQRKMQRYDEHIHSLLSNVKSLKKSLRANEDKTSLLSEEHLQTKLELKDLQKTKIQLEEMRLKYEQSQNTIKDLKQALTFERNKYELSDIGKTAQNNNSSYEVANLIDDYKKLIQQSAVATKRPMTKTILDLIQRSNQCVPNLQKLETNVVDLRSDLQNFLTTFTQKMPMTSMISASSLTVPPSLMDELRIASDGY